MAVRRSLCLRANMFACDTVIIGGGVMGASAACQLARLRGNGQGIVVIEKDPTVRCSRQTSVSGPTRSAVQTCFCNALCWGNPPGNCWKCTHTFTAAHEVCSMHHSKYVCICSVTCVCVRECKLLIFTWTRVCICCKRSSVCQRSTLLGKLNFNAR
jgi:NADPH-dependent 2,4-dienoyl-CoA reductase/sulfur reductase-like enzyme